MRLSSRARRQRVVMRPKVRGQKARQAAAIVAVLFLGAAAAATLRHVQGGGLSLRGLWRGLRPAVRLVKVEGLPADLAGQVQQALSAAAASASEADAARQALARFGFLKSLNCRRDWTGGRLLCSGELRTAVAVIVGRPRSFLDEQGVIFDAPPGYAVVSGPLVENGRAEPAELAGLAAFLVKDAPNLPSPAQRLSYVSPQEGWRIGLQDGTTLLFGNMRWTGEKLQRLGQVMADARSEFSSRQMTADLRYFEDGRILLRPGTGFSPPLPKAGAR